MRVQPLPSVAIVKMPANAGQTSRRGGSIDNAIEIRSSSPAFLTAPTVNSRDSSDSSDSETWEGFSDSSDHEAQTHHNESDNNSDSDDDSDDEVIPRPPTGFLSPTIQALQSAVNDWAKDRGFAVVRQNGRNREGRTRNEGEYTRYDIVCDRYGKPRKSEGVGLRKSTTRKCGCLWKGYAVKTAAGWLYRDDPKAPEHNHAPSTHPSAHPQHRNRRDPAIVEAIAKASRHPGIRAREVGSLIADQFPESTLVDKDIYNTRSELRREELGGRTPTGALIAAFDAEGIPYRVKWADEAKEELVGLVFTTESLMEMTARYWELTQADMTYKTNLFGYPLFQVTSMTSSYHIFNSFFGLVNNERRDAYDFLVTAMKELRAEYEVKEPLVFVTDYCKELKASIAEIFPDTQQQICIFHIMMNIKLNAKKKLALINKKKVDSEDEQEREQADLILDAQERAALARLRAEIQDHEPEPGVSKPVPIEYPHDHHGVEEMFRLIMYAPTEDLFFKA